MRRGRIRECSEQGGHLPGRAEIVYDFAVLGGDATALAPVYVAVEVIPGFGAESGSGDYPDAVHGVRAGLFGGGLVPLPDYPAGGVLRRSAGRTRSSLRLRASTCRRAEARLILVRESVNTFILRSFPVISGHCWVIV